MFVSLDGLFKEDDSVFWDGGFFGGGDGCGEEIGDCDDGFCVAVLELME